MIRRGVDGRPGMSDDVTYSDDCWTKRRQRSGRRLTDTGVRRHVAAGLRGR